MDYLLVNRRLFDSKRAQIFEKCKWLQPRNTCRFKTVLMSDPYTTVHTPMQHLEQSVLFILSSAVSLWVRCCFRLAATRTQQPTESGHSVSELQWPYSTHKMRIGMFISIDPTVWITECIIKPHMYHTERPQFVCGRLKMPKCHCILQNVN